MKRYIIYWHGRTKQIDTKLNKICSYDSDKEQFFWDATLDEFDELWKDKFMILTNGDIAVTDKPSWGQY